MYTTLDFLHFVHDGPHETLQLHQNLLTAATKYTQSLGVYFENPKSSVVLYLALSFLCCFVLLFISYLDGLFQISRKVDKRSDWDIY